jgi:hypothetical protein
MVRACECWQERKVGEKSRRKGSQKGSREREKKSLVSAKKAQRRPREIEGSSLKVRMVASSGPGGKR